MNAFNDRIGRDDDILTVATQDRGIVDETESAGVARQRFEVARNQAILTHWVLTRWLWRQPFSWSGEFFDAKLAGELIEHAVDDDRFRCDRRKHSRHRNIQR